MFNKIFAWVWLVMEIVMVLSWLTTPSQEMWFFVLVFYIGLVYINIKYIESLG